MKNIVNLTQFILIALILASCSQQDRISIETSSQDKQLLFALDEIEIAAEENAFKVSITKSLNAKSSDQILVKVVSDSTLSVQIANDNKLKMPQGFGWQCYAIRIKETGGQKIIYVLSGDDTGAMYGALDIAEALRFGIVNDISDSDNKPYMARRGIKWNMPLDLRTPNYADIGDHYQQNIPTIWEMDFWQQLIDEMVRSRLNLITLHNINPFPSIVKIPEFPDIALDDVHRTKEPLKLQSNLSGLDLVSPEMLNNYEVVKELTMDEKIEFWREVMEYAHNLGVEFVLFTWNIFTYGIDGKYGIDDSQDNETTIKYYRSAVREMVLTYPHLSGIGITAGENMKKSSKYSKEEWLWKTYGLGISDALKIQPERQFRLIHRFHQANMNEIKDAFKDFPGLFDLSYKYTGAHTYSIPDPPGIKSIEANLSPEFRTFLTVRNDDIYSFRWGNPTFVREHILSNPGPEKIAGYYLGGYWAKDVSETNDNLPRPLSIQKRWYEAMLWGRLGYNPSLPDSLFRMAIGSRFKDIPAQTMMDGWSAASMIFPWITRFSWARNDFCWFPEACYQNPNLRDGGFINVDTFIKRKTQEGSNIQNILQWAENIENNSPDNLITPLAVADTLSMYSEIALKNLNSLTDYRSESSTELKLTLVDIEAFAELGSYYSDKIRGACSLALYDLYGHKNDQEDAIQHLRNAKAHWEEYAHIYASQYKPALFSRIGFINIPELIDETAEDIEIAINWKPGIFNK